MLRKILIGLALLVIFVIAAAAYFIHRIDSQLARESEVKLKKLEPHVATGFGMFKKSTFYKEDGLGEVTEILFGWPADREGGTPTVVGNHGADFLTSDGKLKKQVRFSRKDIFCPIEVTKLDARCDYGFLTRDQSWAGDAILFDKQGLERWRYAGGLVKGVDDSVGGLDGNGNIQVVIGFNGDGGVVLVDSAGKKIWRKGDGNVWHVETLDINGDGREEILHSNAKGQLLVRDANGEIIAHYLTDHNVSDFALTRWGTESQARHILVPSQEMGDGCCKPVVLILDANGKTIIHFDTPLGDLMHETRGMPVHFPEKPPYYAVLQTNRSLSRSILFLYDAEGRITYHEILAEACAGIAAMRDKTGDRLLVGCSGNVLEYSPSAKTHTMSVGNR
jgi:hypothetical protein